MSTATDAAGPVVVVAPDSFKGALGAAEAAAAIARGWRDALPDSEVREVPMADGGEGTARTMVAATGGRWVEVEAPDPLGRPVAAGYGVLGADDSGRTRVAVDVATASGLERLTRRELDPWRASSAGTGVLLRHALDAGADEVVLGLGGSATTDGGAGMLAELGAVFLDADGTPVPATPLGLRDVVSVDLAGLTRGCARCASTSRAT